jgi:hypothetical protein
MFFLIFKFCSWLLGRVSYRARELCTAPNLCGRFWKTYSTENEAEVMLFYPKLKSSSAHDFTLIWQSNSLKTCSSIFGALADKRCGRFLKNILNRK